MTSSDYYNDHTWGSPGAGSLGLSALKDAYGLDDESRDWVEALVDEFESHEEHNAMLEDYYDGRVTVADYGVGSDIRNDQTCHWPQQAVDALASRVHLERFASDDGRAVEILNEIDARCGIVSGYNAYIGSKYLYGCMCATVNNTQDGPSVMFHSARTFTAIPDGGRCMGGTVAAGLAIARFERPSWDRLHAVPTVVHVYLPHNTIELVQKERDGWVAEMGPHPLEKPMLYVFTHNRKGGVAPFGQTRITRFVRTLTDDAIRCLWHMQVSGSFYSMAKMYITGLSDEQFNAMISDKQKYQLDRLLLLTEGGAGEGENAKVGQLSGNSPQPFIDELRSLASQFSGATGVPLNSLGIVQDNPSSAEAIQAAREDICLIARRDAEDDKAVLANMAGALLGIAGEQPADVRAKYSDPLLNSMASKADWATKVSAIMPSFGDTDVAARLVGLDEADIAELRSERTRATANAIMQRLAFGATTPNGEGVE